MTVGIALFVVLILLYLVSFRLRTQYQPSDIVAKPDTVFLGRVPEESMSPFSVLIENHGDRIAIINSVGTSCGCTTASTNSLSIEPHKVAVVNGFLRAEMPPGHYSRIVFVNMAKPDTRIYIPVDVIVYNRGYSLDNGNIDFGSVMLGSSETREVRVTVTQPELKLHPCIKSCPSWLAIKWMQEGSNKWIAQLVASSGNATKDFDDYVLIDPGTPDSKSFYIHLTMKATGQLKCEPNQLNLGIVTTNKSVTAQISTGLSGHLQLAVKSLPVGVKATFAQTPMGELLRVEVSSDHSGRVISDNICLHVVSPSLRQRYLNLPITALLQ